MYKATKKASPARYTIFRNSIKMTQTVNVDTTMQVCAERNFNWQLFKRREYKTKWIAPNMKATGIQFRRLADGIR
jgi:hypothetical protein